MPKPTARRLKDHASDPAGSADGPRATAGVVAEALMSAPVGIPAQVVMVVTIATEYGTVEAGEWDAVPPSEFVHLSNSRKMPDLVRNLPAFHTDGVFRNRSRVQVIGSIPDAPSAEEDGITLDLYLVQVAAIL